MIITIINYILQTLDQFAIACSGYLSYPLVFVKREISYEVTTFSADGFSWGGGGDHYLQDKLTPVELWNVIVSFIGSLLLRRCYFLIFMVST